jgi:hypothetical protein
VRAVDGSHCIDFFFGLSGICDETTKTGVEKTIFSTELISRTSQNGNHASCLVPFYLVAKVQEYR